MAKYNEGVAVTETERLGSYEASRRLKSVNTTLAKLRSQRKKLQLEKSYADAEIPNLTKQIKELEAELDTFQSQKVVVSEHALLRYLERYRGIDLNTVGEEVAKLPQNMVVQRGHVIVTIIDDAVTDLATTDSDTTTKPVKSAPKSTNDKDDKVRAIAEILWQFHKDRLDDPSINEMKPYIQPILDLFKAEGKRG